MGITLQSDCKDCSEGKYGSFSTAPRMSDSDCTSCLTGKFNNRTGMVSNVACRDCAAGLYSGPGTGKTACGGACSKGRFSSTVGIASNDQCLGRCSAGRWSNRTGVSHDDGCLGACSTGRWSNGSVGLIFDSQCSGRCAAGTFMDDGSVGNTNGSKCQGRCSKGRYSTRTGLSSNFGCEGRCGMGKYSITMGLTSGEDCKACPQGTTTNAEGASSKRSCVVPPAEVTSFRPECGEIIDAVEGENATSTAATATLCSNNGAEQRMTLYGTNFKDTTTVTVGGSLCTEMIFNQNNVAAESSQVTCRLPRTAGGAMLIRLDGVVPQGLDKPFVMFGCPSASIEAPHDPLKPSACVFDSSDRSISPPASPCSVLDITNMASGGCNNDIYIPSGTDADYVATLIEYMAPVASIAIVLCLLFAISVGILLYFRSPFVYFLRKCDVFGGNHSTRDGAARRVTKTALGGFISFLFLSSLSIFGVYAVTSYVQLSLLS